MHRDRSPDRFCVVVRRGGAGARRVNQSPVPRQRDRTPPTSDGAATSRCAEGGRPVYVAAGVRPTRRCGLVGWAAQTANDIAIAYKVWPKPNVWAFKALAPLFPVVKSGAGPPAWWHSVPAQLLLSECAAAVGGTPRCWARHVAIRGDPPHAARARCRQPRVFTVSLCARWPLALQLP
eukprot:5391771-Prymnesium_polylepis.1